MKPKLSKRQIFIGASLLILLWLFFAMCLFLRSLSTIEQDATERSLVATAKSNAEQVRFVFDRHIGTLKTIAVALEDYEAPHSPEALAYLERIAILEDYEALAVDYADGRSYLFDGTQHDISKQPYLSRLGSAKPLILDLAQTPFSAEAGISILVPLRSEGNTAVALHCILSPSQLSLLFDKTFFRTDSYYHLIDSKGNYVAAGNSPSAILMDSSFFDAIDALDYESGFSSTAILDSFRNRQAGFSKYSYDGQQRYAYHLPVGINNWVLMMISPKDLVEKTITLHRKNSILLSAQIFFIFLCTLVLIYLSQNRAKRTAILHEKCFRALAEQTGKLIFDWDLTTNRISCLSDFRSIFGRDPFTNGTADEAISQEVIHEEDRKVFRDVFSNIMQGKPVHNAVFRILDENDSYHWCSLNGLVVDDERGRPFKAIGSLESIDEQLRREGDLRRLAETDSLTGLYNKATTEFLIEEALSEPIVKGHLHALLIIDVDNFKNINDNFGHLYGDTVLSALSDILKHTFRSEDIVGRLGGDEFFVFVKNFASVELLYARAEAICNQFRHTYVENGQAVHISASVGLAIFPAHGETFDALYQNADIALYTVKANGKDNFFLYDGQNKPDYLSERAKVDTPALVETGFQENRIEYVFKLLYDAEDPVDAINATLRLITKHFDFLRSYLFELDESGQVAKHSFSWQGADAEGSPLPRSLPRETCSYQSTSSILILHETDSTLHESDRNYLQLHQLHAIVHFPIFEDKQLHGFIRFDDRKQARTLSRTELNELGTLCHVLCAFLVKQRSSERELQHYAALRETMDHLDSFVYVVDPLRYEILYENKKVRALTDLSSVGKTCHQSYRGCAFPCEDCPISANQQGADRKVHMRDEKRKLYLRVSATPIRWAGGLNAMLINGVDISEYQDDLYL